MCCCRDKGIFNTKDGAGASFNSHVPGLRCYTARRMFHQPHALALGHALAALDNM